MGRDIVSSGRRDSVLHKGRKRRISRGYSAALGGHRSMKRHRAIP